MTVLCDLTCGRSATPSDAARASIAAQFASTTERRTITHGVRSAERGAGSCTPPLRPTGVEDADACAVTSSSTVQSNLIA